ncbi:hypothetical protein MPSEU_000620600 [Mayamaea pseudoterrestris]|nr:hypothetical protein MPSEU_000620600 [Mayamaea pseudoterrestris]
MSYSPMAQRRLSLDPSNNNVFPDASPTRLKNHRPPAQVFTKGNTGAVVTSLSNGSNGGISSTSFSSNGSATKPTTTAPTSKRFGMHESAASADCKSSMQQRKDETMVTPIISNRIASQLDYDYLTEHSDHSSPMQAPMFYPTQSEQREPIADRSTSRGSNSQSSRGSNGKQQEYSTSVSLQDYSRMMRSLLDDLSHAPTRQDRLSSLRRLTDACNHEEEGLHNVGLSVGAVNVLARCLALSTHDEEIDLLVAGLEMVLRASQRNVQLAYLSMAGLTMNISIKSSASWQNQQFQQNSLVINLLKVMERCELGVMAKSETTMLKCTKCLLHFAACPDLRQSLLRQDGMLDALARVPAVATDSTLSAPKQRGKMFSPKQLQPEEILHMPLDCRLLRLELASQLATCEANKGLLFEKEGLVDCVVKCAHMDACDLIRQYAGMIFMELASAPTIQLRMANDEKVLGILVKMVFVERGTVVRESVITALQNMAFAKENRMRLVSFKDGVLLEALKQALSSDVDPKARRRAAGVLTNLVCTETANTMGMHNGLLDVLAIVSTKDENDEVQTRASLALTKIANCITARMECHEALLDALVVASLSKATNSISAVLRVKARDAANREVMARHAGVVDTLCDLCISDGSSTTDKDNAMRAIMHLCNEPKNRNVLCTRTVLEALVEGANYTDPDLEEARDSAIRALERLGTEPTNREFMARREGLLTAVAKAVEREADWEESGKEAEHGYLAKPLLMSLLVSM